MLSAATPLPSTWHPAAAAASPLDEVPLGVETMPTVEPMPLELPVRCLPAVDGRGITFTALIYRLDGSDQ